jgi:hypothetical protein
VKVSIVFPPSPQLGPDPLDTTARKDRRIGEFLDGDKLDVLVIWREVGEEYEGGQRTQIASAGIWSRLTASQIETALEAIYSDGLG